MRQRTGRSADDVDRGAQIYSELCFSCHGADGYGAPRPGDASGATMAPRLVGSPRVNGHRDYVIKAVLHGMTGPLDGDDLHRSDDAESEQPGRMGRSRDVVRAQQLRKFRRLCERRRCRARSRGDVLAPDPVDRHGAGSVDAEAARSATTRGSCRRATTPRRAARALTMTSWNSQAAQAPGMWFQVELPQPAMVTEIQFTSTGGGRGGGGGGGGRDAAPRPEHQLRRQARRQQASRAATRSRRRLNGTTWTRRGRGDRERAVDNDHVPPGAGEVRANDADGGRRRRATLVDSADAVVRSLCAGCTLRHRWNRVK